MAYQNIKRASRGSRWPLRPNDLLLKSVNNEALNIIRIVRLPMSLGKNTPSLKLDFYIVSNFSLPTDGLLGLTTLKSHKIVIKPDKNAILYQSRCFRAMVQPMSLTALPKPVRQPESRTSIPQAGVLAVQNTSPVSNSIRNTYQNLMKGDWKLVKAIVVGDHEIPTHVAMHIPISVPKATVGCDICIEGPSQVQRVYVEPILTTMRDGHNTTALVVNTTGGSVKLKHGLFLSKALVYDQRVVPKPPEFPQACVTSVDQSPSNSERGQDPTLSSYVSVVDYPELTERLLKLLGRYREAIAVPGEPLGATSCLEHHIKLKPGTQPIYVPAYRLPHS